MILAAHWGVLPYNLAPQARGWLLVSGIMEYKGMEFELETHYKRDTVHNRSYYNGELT